MWFLLIVGQNDFRHVRLGSVAPEPRLGSPLRTPLNLHE
jgi:hypothetical protein